ncbi:MAG: hypothetical protein KC656_32325 [Myxococcales bacterium]|nr:hypothetical protein [Myxococcales bacterium]MCA9572587.1 hypothetical protein [Myxococcales bacterium]
MRHDDRFPPEVEEALREGALDEILFNLQGPGIVLLDPTPVPVQRPSGRRSEARVSSRPTTWPLVVLALCAAGIVVVWTLWWWL